jgi:hypothetical protein
MHVSEREEGAGARHLDLVIWSGRALTIHDSNMPACHFLENTNQLFFFGKKKLEPAFLDLRPWRR